ncbi:hypothetical protein WA158_001268 [Blastocystis sp. Blastoise]
MGDTKVYVVPQGNSEPVYTKPVPILPQGEPIMENESVVPQAPQKTYVEAIPIEGPPRSQNSHNSVVLIQQESMNEKYPLTLGRSEHKCSNCGALIGKEGDVYYQNKKPSQDIIHRT